MVNIKKKSNIKNLTKLFLAVFVLFFFWLFMNDSTYNLMKKPFVKNSAKYDEMYAYIKSKPNVSKKYFIRQDNSSAESFFKGEVEIVPEDSLDNIRCSEGEVVFVYEKPSSKIDGFIARKGGETLVLNRDSDIEFYAAKTENSPESCNIN